MRRHQRVGIGMGSLTGERSSCGKGKSVGCTDMHFPTVELGVSDDV